MLPSGCLWRALGVGAGQKGAFRKVRYATWVRLLSHVRPPTSEGHNFFVRIPIRVCMDSMEIPLSQYSIRMPLDGIGCLSWPERGVRESKVGCPGKTA